MAVWLQTVGIAQTPPSLSVQMNAGCTGLTVTGESGMTCQIQWSDSLSNSSRWFHLGHRVLSAQPSSLSDFTSSSPETRYYRAVLTPSTNFVWIQPGTFTMGCSATEVDRSAWDGPQTVVTLTKGSWMGKYEATQGEYAAVMGNNPSYFQPPDFAEDLSRPVELVTWDQARDFCAALTEQEQAAGRIPTNSAYRLSTEAEWEYACRAGTKTRFSYGDDPGYTLLSNYAWYGVHTSGESHPVGQKLPNPWGLYDMYGNVWEQCQDYWSDVLPGGSAVDPQGPDTGAVNVICGGGFRSYPEFCRSGCRFFGYGLDSLATDIGIRVMLDPGQP